MSQVHCIVRAIEKTPHKATRRHMSIRCHINSGPELCKTLSVNYEADSVRNFPRGGPNSCAEESQFQDMASHGACKVI